jgi:hypothetical protein
LAFFPEIGSSITLCPWARFFAFAAGFFSSYAPPQCVPEIDDIRRWRGGGTLRHGDASLLLFQHSTTA